MTGAPVATTFRRQDCMDNAHPNYIGDLGVRLDPKMLSTSASL